MGLLKKITTVASGTMMSRLFGFVREMMMAAILGTGPVADAFNAAFRFPNSFRRLFAEGAFNSAFVPLFAKSLDGEGMEEARRFSEEVFGVLFSILLILTIVMELAMPLLVTYVIAPGFVPDATKFEATVRLATIMFPYLSLMSLAAMMGGMLNALHRYFAAAIAPVFLNVILIGLLLYAWAKGLDVWQVGLSLSWGVMAAGLVQLLIVWCALRRAGMRISWRFPRLTANVRRLLWLALPAAMTGGITQINLLINTNIASKAGGAVSSLAYADRLYQLPLGIVGIAVATVLLPELSRALRGSDLNLERFPKSGNRFLDKKRSKNKDLEHPAEPSEAKNALEQFLKSGNRFSDKNCGKNKELERSTEPSEVKISLVHDLQNRAVEFSLFLTLPASVIFITLSEPIVRLLFERGSFDATSTAVVGAILSIYGLGLPAFVLIKALIPGFFAREDSKTPMIFAGISVLVNITLAITLFPLLSARGIAIAEITAAWVNIALLFVTLIKRGHWQLDKTSIKRLLCLIPSSAMMGLALYVGAHYFQANLSAGLPVSILAGTLFALIAAAMLLYVALVILTGGMSLKQIKSALRRR